jgi:O-antigen/teichoic acid export membrane protein
MLLFADQLVTAGGGWIYWVVFSKLVSPTEIGETTTVYTIAVLMVLFSELGLEYPLLKKSKSNPSQALGTTILIEIGLVICVSPILFIAINSLYEETIQVFAWIAIMIMVCTSFSFVLRYLLLGTFSTTTVFIINSVCTIIKFFVAFVLVSFGFGTLGLLVSFFLQAFLLSIMYLVYCIKKFSISLGSWDYIKGFIMEGLVNTPSKLARMLSLNLSIILLASVGIASSEVGTFYIALTISITVSSLITSMAFMIIPASAESKSNLSYISLKYGISLTAPLIAGLVSAPQFILSLIGPQYVSEYASLTILSVAILPYSILTTSISSFNFTGDFRKIVMVGSVQVVIFLVSFLLLAPYYGTIGTSFAILLAFFSSSVMCLVWVERIVLKIVGKSIIALALGWLIGYSVNLLNSDFDVVYNQIVSIISAVSTTLIALLILKNLSLSELKQMTIGLLNTSFRQSRL